MSKNILVLHASDGFNKAYDLNAKFNEKGYKWTPISSLFGKNEKDNSESLVRKLIDDNEIIVVVVSPGLFASCALRFGIAYALGRGMPLISVKDNLPVLVPSWFRELFSQEYSEAEILSKLKETIP